MLVSRIGWCIRYVRAGQGKAELAFEKMPSSGPQRPHHHVFMLNPPEPLAITVVSEMYGSCIWQGVYSAPNGGDNTVIHTKWRRSMAPYCPPCTSRLCWGHYSAPCGMRSWYRTLSGVFDFRCVASSAKLQSCWPSKASSFGVCKEECNFVGPYRCYWLENRGKWEFGSDARCYPHP